MCQLSAQRLLDHQVDQLAGHADGLDDRLASSHLATAASAAAAYPHWRHCGPPRRGRGPYQAPGRRSAPYPRWTRPSRTRARRRCRHCPRSRAPRATARRPKTGRWGKDAHDILSQAVAQRLVAVSTLGGVEVGARRVNEFHDGRDGGVELAAIEVLGALGDGPVTLAIELHRNLVERGLVEGHVGVAGLDELPHDTPGALDEAVGALNGLGIPVEVLLGRGDKQDRQTHGVGAVGLDDRARGHDVALGLGHGVAVLVLDHALAQQVGEGLVHTQQAQVAQCLGKEAAVEQVQNGVLDAADVVIDGHPTIGSLAGEGQLGVVRVGIAQVIPAGASEGVHGIGLALGRAAADRAGGLVELLALGEGLAGARSRFSGSVTGSWSSGTGTMPQCSQWMAGMGLPQ